MNKSNTSIRLNEIMKLRNLRQVDILEKCKPYCDKYNIRLGRNDLSQYISGKVTPGQEKLSILAMALGINEAWLMGYDVPMERNLSIDKLTPDMLDSFADLNEGLGQVTQDLLNMNDTQSGELKTIISKFFDNKCTTNEERARVYNDLYKLINYDIDKETLKVYPIISSEPTIEASETELTKSEKNHIDKYRAVDEKGKHTVDTVLDMEYSRCSNIVPFTKETPKKKYEPTEDDIKSLVARNGKTLTREQAIDLISTLFSDDDDE